MCSNDREMKKNALFTISQILRRNKFICFIKTFRVDLTSKVTLYKSKEEHQQNLFCEILKTVQTDVHTGPHCPITRFLGPVTKNLLVDHNFLTVLW